MTLPKNRRSPSGRFTILSALSILALVSSNGCTTEVQDLDLGTGSKNGNESSSSPVVPSDASAETSGTADGTHPAKGGGNNEGKDDGACRNGATLSCSQTPEGVSILFPGGEVQGSCRLGEKMCDGGQWGPCLRAIAPKAKDTCEPGNDDNCNGIRNDHCNCIAGETQPCGSNVGACQEGVQHCQGDGTWGKTCDGEIEPKAEKCDGNRIDEDCDGSADLKDEDCSCNTGEVRGCTIESAQGDCRLGSQYCKDGAWSETCEPRFKPEPEICGIRTQSDNSSLPSPNGDEDCDGRRDESDKENNFNPGGPERLRNYYMIDDDRDGWGKMVGPGETKSDVARVYCKGRESDAPEKWVEARKEQLNRDCGDCEKSGDEVRPDYAGGYRESPNYCLRIVGWKGGQFDYNCSGKAEKQFEEQFRCDLSHTSCLDTRREGWVSDEVPRCGQISDWQPREGCFKETPEADFCTRTHIFTPKTQACQ